MDNFTGEDYFEFVVPNKMEPTEANFKKFLSDQALWYGYIEELKKKLHQNYSPEYVGIYGLNTDEIIERAVKDNVITPFDRKLLKHFIRLNGF